MTLDYSIHLAVLALCFVLAFIVNKSIHLVGRDTSAENQINMTLNCTFDVPFHVKYSSGGSALAN